MTELTPTDDDVARAIVVAARATGADPIDVASGVSDRKRGRHAGENPYPIFRARAYAAKGLAAVFTSYWRTRIAGHVGAQGMTRQSYFSALDQRINENGDWWDKAVLASVIDAIRLGRVPRAVPSETPQPASEAKPSTPIAVPRQPAPAPFKAGPLPPHDTRKLGPATEAPATRLKRVLGDLGPPRRTAVEEGLERRARERNECRDLLAEAAANTAKLPIPKAPGDD